MKIIVDVFPFGKYRNLASRNQRKFAVRPGCGRCKHVREAAL
jgi:hypothetical protein